MGSNHLRRRTRLDIIPAVMAFMAVTTAPAAAETWSIAQRSQAIAIDSGPVVNLERERAVIFTRVIRIDGAPWLRLHLAATTLGDAPTGGGPTQLRITSQTDGATQTLTATTLPQWRCTSAYFNGGAVRVEVIADSLAAPSRLVIDDVIVGIHDDGGGIAGSCDPDDDRIPSDDRRVGRTMPTICTAWIMDDVNRCMLSAGHCFDPPAPELVEFNVPASLADGTLQHPPPADQYSIDPASVQYEQGPLFGTPDWAYFGCFPNSETGLTAAEAQRGFFATADVVSEPLPDEVMRLTGYGMDMTPPEVNGTLQTATGPYLDLFMGMVVGPVLVYSVDSGGGTSGSPLIRESDGVALGLHTGVACALGGGVGTAMTQTTIQAALANPQGVCASSTPDPADLNGDGQVNGFDLALLLGQWTGAAMYAPCPPIKPADLDSDCKINGIDLAILLAAWGRGG